MISMFVVFEILLYMLSFVIIVFNVSEWHSWNMPVGPMIALWNALDKENINIVGKIIAEIFAAVATLRFLIVGYMVLIFYDCWIYSFKLFKFIFKK